MAVAGGVNVLTNPDGFTGLGKGHFLTKGYAQSSQLTVPLVRERLLMTLIADITRARLGLRMLMATVELTASALWC